MREILPPFQEQLQLLIFPAVKEIAHHQQLPRPEILDLAKQTQQILPVYRLWHRDPRLAEMPGLAKMQV